MPEGDSADPYPSIINVLIWLQVENLPLLLLVFILLCFSAVISASEVALFSLSPEQKKRLNESTKKSHQYILELLDRPKKLLATILIGNNLVNISIVILSTYLISLFITSDNPTLYFIIQVVLVTTILLLFGEILPKIFANTNPLKVAEYVSPFMMYCQKLFSPLSSILISSTNFLDTFFENKNKGISVNELSHALELTSESIQNEDDKKILQGIVKFGTLEVSQIMKPRMYAVAIDIETDFDELLRLINEHGYSRIPVYKETFDKIEGIINIKDLLPHINNPHFKWQTILRPAFFVPENKKIDDLLKEFQDKKIHMAVVVDEYGGTSGIVTLEDILEEIVGDITDEYDDEDINYTKIDEKNYVFEARVLLTDFYKILQIDPQPFEKQKGTAETLAGFILEITGKIPQKNEKITFYNYHFLIESADKRKIKQIKVTLPNT